MEKTTKLEERRVTLPQYAGFNWKASLWAGFLAGCLFLLLELLTYFIVGTPSPFGPAHTLVVGITSSSATIPNMTAQNIIAGLLLHFILAVSLTIVLARLVQNAMPYVAITAGFIFGFFLYFINFYVFTFWMPLFDTIRDIWVMVNYILFGAGGALFYTLLRKTRRTAVVA